MNKIIPFDKNYEFEFIEEKIKINHPLSDYYMKLDEDTIFKISFKKIR